MARKASKQFQVGDRVAYSANWLRSTQTHGLGHWRGTVAKIKDWGTGVQLVYIAWDGQKIDRPDEPENDDGLGHVISPNLTLVSRLAIDAALAG